MMARKSSASHRRSKAADADLALQELGSDDVGQAYPCLRNGPCEVGATRQDSNL